MQHPLDPLTVAEIEAGRAVLESAGRVTSTTRCAAVLPVEPSKEAVAAWLPGETVERRILFVALDTSSGRSAEAVVEVTTGTLESWTELTTDVAPYGQPPYLREEFELTEQIVRADPQWQAAMARRGLSPEFAFCAPLAPGFFGRDDEAGHRVIRSLTFLREDAHDSPWSHPVEGLIVHIDLTQRRVLRVEDEGNTPVPSSDGRFGTPAALTERVTLKPIAITQPEGPSYSVDGSAVTWENWSFRVGFNAREGLVLNQVAFDGRPVLYRASVPEMVVPYGDTSPTRFWISYFDAGEYLLGMNANPLMLGCDCLGVIHYFDGVIADGGGHAVTIPQAVCMHEEDYGVLWKHTHLDGTADSRRSRRLVISYFSTIGNYDYGFFWYLYLDGSIEFEAKATGVVFAGAGVPGSSSPHANEIAPGLFAPVHQHLFCARLDVSIDGDANSLAEIDVVRMPTGPDNPHGNAFTWTTTELTSELEAKRVANPAAARVWEITSGSRRNAVGKPTAYHLVPRASATLMAQPDSSVFDRATFATQQLWATPFSPAERFPAGDYPNGHAGGGGLPTWTAADRSIENTDIVLWHVFGPTHIPRPEDWPVMPVDYSGFTFRPYGFLDRNPALDLPSGMIHDDHCAPHGSHHEGHGH
ncbi:MAG: primary-amine oxidase [Salinibacterium sp.]|nr:primary-amine oxidase [Salinibacterium sp.]